LGKRREAEAEYRAAVAIGEGLVADFPADAEYRVALGGSYGALANHMKKGSNPVGCLPWYDKSIAMLTVVIQQQPNEWTPAARQTLRVEYWNRAMVYESLRRSTEAISDWNRAIELSSGNFQLVARAQRANSRVRAGQCGVAVGEVAELAESDAWGNGEWYDFACVYAVASDKVAGKREEYAGRAVELLGKAIAKGYKDTGHMAVDSDLDPLRSRADFRKLVADLEAKHPRPAELAPPPRPAK